MARTKPHRAHTLARYNVDLIVDPCYPVDILKEGLQYLFQIKRGHTSADNQHAGTVLISEIASTAAEMRMLGQQLFRAVLDSLGTFFQVVRRIIE